MTPLSDQYQQAYQRFGEAALDFQHAALDEIRSLIPEHIHGVLVHLNDTPRLALWGAVDGDGNEDAFFGETEEGEAIDQIAADLDFTDFDQPDSLLIRHEPDGWSIDTRWIITREEGA